MTAGRFHLTLVSAGRPVAHGWWPREETARAQFSTWVGLWSSVPQARVTLVDEEAAEVLEDWAPSS